MLFISVAMQAEAVPFISGFKLQKKQNINKFRVYGSDRCVLVVTGTGPVRSALATSFMLTRFNASPSDFWVNVGVCAARPKADIGHLYIVNRIRDNVTGSERFPDMLYRHDFTEAGVETCQYPVIHQDKIAKDILLADMEAYGAFEAAQRFVPLHRMAILKVVADHFTPEKIKTDHVKRMVNDAAPRAINWLSRVVLEQDCARETIQDSSRFTGRWAVLERAVSSLDLSKTMAVEFRQVLRYLSLVDVPMSNGLVLLIENIISNNACIKRRDAKKILARLKEEALGLPAPLN